VALILDAGAGTGLLGAALAELGFTSLDALDLSPAMLAEARRKGIYGRLTEARLGDPLPYDTGAYDAVVACGVLTTGHAPASCLDELVRITRPGGHVVFTLRSDRVPAGYDERTAALLDDGRWQLVERGDELQAMPTGEPEVLVRVWAFRVS
jgi:SAM-dependent methyltransferase